MGALNIFSKFQSVGFVFSWPFLVFNTPVILIFMGLNYFYGGSAFLLDLITEGLLSYKKRFLALGSAVSFLIAYIAK